MSRTLSLLAAAVALLAAPTTTPAQTINPPPPPGGGQLVCVVCPPDLVASSTRHHAPFMGIPYWQVEIANLGGPTTQSSTAAVRFWLPGSLEAFATSVSVGPLATGQRRVVLHVYFANWGPEACADAGANIAERNENNNCT